MSDLFRKEAMDSFSSNANIDRSLHTTLTNWNAIAGVILMCAVIFAGWFFFGKIYETIPVEGVVWPDTDGGRLNAKHNGQVTQTIFSVGDSVNAGDILAIIPDNDMLDALENDHAGFSDADIRNVYDKYSYNSIVTSNVDGIVAWICEENTWVSEGELVAYVIPYNSEFDYMKVTAFIESEKSGLIKLNMDAHVIPGFAPVEEYGYIEAHVSDIIGYSATGEKIKEQNGYMPVSNLDDKQSYTQINITMLHSDDSVSKLLWSNKAGNNLDISVGTLCTADIVIRECSPFELLIGRSL